LPEVLVALTIGGLLVAALTALEVRLARSGLQVARVGELMRATYAFDTVQRCRARPDLELRAIAKQHIGPGKSLELETATYLRSDQKAAAGVSYAALWSRGRTLLWGALGQRCGLAERCEYDVDLAACRPPRAE
jgi:hypothetical protein